MFFFIDFCPKATLRGDFVKIFENVHKMENFRKFSHIFKWENRIHKNYTHIFSKKQCSSESIESTLKKNFPALRVGNVHNLEKIPLPENMHILEHLREFHKFTRRGDFVKIFENLYKMEQFRKFLLVFKWENTIHKNYTYIFSKHQCSESI